MKGNRQKNKSKRLSRVQLEDRLADLEVNWKRALADYLNLEKRVEKERSGLVKLANAQLIDKLLPVLDELEICQKHLKDKGIQMVIDKFSRVLQSEEVEEIEALGQEFNPETMDAVEIVPGQRDKVIEVAAKGYRLNGRIIRPVKVRVGQGEGKKKRSA